jgi:hypothetical protein
MIPWDGSCRWKACMEEASGRQDKLWCVVCRSVAAIGRRKSSGRGKFTQWMAISNNALCGVPAKLPCTTIERASAGARATLHSRVGGGGERGRESHRRKGSPPNHGRDPNNLLHSQAHSYHSTK